MAPFPVYDTDYVKDVDNLIKIMEENKDTNYDSEPVWACRHCKTLVVPNCFDIDDLGNESCLRCGSINEIEEFENINEYLKFKRSNK
jgi:hypothetical protein